MGNDTKRRLAAAAAFLMLATAGSRVLGLVREQVMLAYLGLTPAMGAFTVAFKVPGLIRTLLADTALSAAFIPVFSELLQKDRRREAWQVAYTITFLATLILGAVSVLGMVFAPQLIGLFGFRDPAVFELAVNLTRIMFPSVVVLGVAGIFMGILNTYDHFSLPALAPIVWNLVIIGSVAIFARRHGEQGFYALAWGVLAGTVMELLIQVPAVWRRREQVSGLLALGHPAVRQTGRLLGPVVLSLGIINFNAFIDTWVATIYISDTAPAIIDKAFRLFQLPQGMFAVAIGTVLFPTLSRLATGGRTAEFRASLSTGIRQIFFITLPFTAFFIMLGGPTVRLLFQHGLFTSADTHEVARALAFFSLGMAFVSANTLLNRAFYGIQKAWLPLMLGVGNLALNAGLDLLLYKPLGPGGITLSTSLVSTFNFLGLIFLLRRQIGGVDGRRIYRSASRSLLALLPLAAAGYGSWRILEALLGDSVLAQLLSVSTGYAVGLGAYVLVARMLGMEEIGQVIGVLRRRRDPRDVQLAVPPEDRNQG